jgi:dipeptidyl aminopeptidase/acylaminoacyl peptidase
MPAGYEAGRRYPLVIQTHGFSESWFTPSGSFPTAFAARELAAAGIAVLQIGGGKQCGNLVADEASCEVRGFESGAKQLVSEGLIDSQEIGYIGFSRSCWYGMEMLTNSSLPLRTALLADGVTGGYLEYLLFGVDLFHEGQETPAPAFGEGLQLWVKKSPGFHLDKVTAPVLIPVEKDAAISMWQPYAGLRKLNKPVEMILLNSDEHPTTNPVARLTSQGLSVDWFRFWLQGHEDPDPAKAEQYKRWRGLRELQAENQKKSSGAQDGLH